MRVICSNGLVLDSNDYLQHHGILGQKWGKKNGPPYPLGASDHSASEKKAGWKDSLNSSDNKRQAKKKYKRAEEVSDANRTLKYAQANLKGDQLSLKMSKHKLGRSKLSVKRAEAIKKLLKKKRLSVAKEDLDIAKGKKIVESIYDESTLSNMKTKMAEYMSRDKEIKAIKKNTEVSAAERAYNDALVRDLNRYEKKHGEFDGDGGEFTVKMRNDKNSESSKAYKKYMEVLGKYGVKDKDAIKQLKKQYKANSHLDRRKAETERGRQLEKAADRAENKYQDAVDDAMYRYGKRDTPEVKKAKAVYDKAVSDWKSYRDSDQSAKDVSKMASRASSMRTSGKTYAEIAKALGIPESSVGYYLNA